MLRTGSFLKTSLYSTFRDYHFFTREYRGISCILYWMSYRATCIPLGTSEKNASSVYFFIIIGNTKHVHQWIKLIALILMALILLFYTKIDAAARQVKVIFYHPLGVSVGLCVWACVWLYNQESGVCAKPKIWNCDFPARPPRVQSCISV